MKFTLKKTCIGILDTAIERKRIAKAFKRDPEVRKQLTEFMDAIEAMDWKKAVKLLSSEWWKGRDEKEECPRTEFIGLLSFGKFLHGFDPTASYADLAFTMLEKRLPDSYPQYTLKKVKE
jgi:hypothetical protein